jgi:hypothetical protein
MKNLKINLFSSLIACALLAGILIFSSCSSSDEGDPCSAVECLNGGEKIAGTDECLCDCPAGYSGLNCEIEEKKCPSTVECPIGKTPNPAHGCACE